VESPKHDYQINAFQNMKKCKTENTSYKEESPLQTEALRTLARKKNRQMELIFLTGFCAANPRLISLSKSCVALILSPSAEKQITKKSGFSHPYSSSPFTPKYFVSILSLLQKIFRKTCTLF
jgi:hypothetical protein